MLLIKGALIVPIILILIFYQLSVNAKNIAREADYEASGDYFEIMTTTTVSEESTTIQEKSTSESDGSEEEDSDDGVTCSETNVTQVLSNYELENYVLVLFKVNVTSNEKELF